MDEVKQKSLAKALRVLECFDIQNPELGITQIGERLGLNKSNVHDIVSTFERFGYLERNPANSKYRIGLKMLEFSYVINEHLGYQRAVYHILQGLSSNVGEIVFFGIPKNGMVLYLDAMYPKTHEFDYPARLIMGEKAPMYCTSIGKAMLAFLPREEAERHIVAPKQRFTDRTIVDTDALRRELDHVREVGYAIDDGEHEYGVKCIGVPVFDGRSQVVAGVSISGSSVAMERVNLEQYADMLKQAAFRMRDRL